MSLTITDLFCGAGGSSLGAELAGATLRLGLNHWDRAIETHSRNFQHADHDCEDVSSLTTAQIRRYPTSDILLASPECFPAGTLILTSRGCVPIEEVGVGALVLTHMGRWRVVTRVQKKVADTVIVRGQGHTPGIEVTAEHPFYLRHSRLRWNQRTRRYARQWDDPDWSPIGGASNGEWPDLYWATPAPSGSREREDGLSPETPPAIFGENPTDAWWLVGRWLADGSLTFGSGRCEVSICCGFHEEEELGARLDATGVQWKYRALRTAALYGHHDQEARDWLEQWFGHGARNKLLPGWTLTLDAYAREHLLAGYVSGDGHVSHRRASVTSVSKALALGARLLAESLGYRAGLYCYEQRADMIEGRLVNVAPLLWVAAWELNKSSRETYQEPLEQHVWSRVRSIEPGRPGIEVFNLEVAEDHSFVAEGIVVHNCTNHSLAKGGRRRKPKAPSLWEDGPGGDAEQDRSRATMWDVVRFAEQKLLQGHPYKGIVVENVTDAFKWGYEDDGGLFQAWLQAMRALGYEHEIVWLNSMFCPPTPQSRDRMYVVFWKKGIRHPNLRVEPPSWCPACERIVAGQQAWKKPDRPFENAKGHALGSKYGDQYVYICPACNGVVYPGAFPAATAIDWMLPAERIGDRKRPLADSTRERIRRGLERLSQEPFAIRLLQGGNPRPLTLPLVTLTRRHDVGMVLPTSGNLFERTPGNRARRLDLQPADVICQTGERGIVLPPMGNVDGRDAEVAPSPTQTTTTRPSLVLSNRAHNVPRPAGERPTHPVLTGEHLGVVELQNHGGVRDLADPVHTVRGGGNHHAVVMRNNGGDETGWASTPSHEPCRALTTRCHQSLVFPYGSEPHGPEEPARTLTTHDRLALLVPAGGSWRRDATPAHEPAPTLTGTESTAVAWGDEDIDACRFRMFALHEIAATMVMDSHTDGSEYVVVGNKREQMAQYGGAVTPPAMELLVSRLVEVLAG